MTATAGEGGVTLGRLVDDLGPVVQLVRAPRGTDVLLGHPVIHDPAGPVSFGADDLVLAVGVRPNDRAAQQLLQAAQQVGAAGLALKGEDLAGLVDELPPDGPALLLVDPEADWGQLHGLVRMILASAGQTAEASGGGARLGDLFALANAVAAMCKGAVTIEDPQARVLAYSSMGQEIDVARNETILGRRVPEKWLKRLRDAGVFRRLWSSPEPVRVERGDIVPAGAPDSDAPFRTRLAIGVRAGEELLGVIWVAEGDQPFDLSTESALKEAAGIATLHLVRHQVRDDLDRRRRAEALRALLQGQGDLASHTERLELDARGSFAVIAFNAVGGPEAEATLRRERLSSRVAAYCEAYRREVSLAAVGRTLYALLPMSADTGVEALRRLAGEVIAHTGDAFDVHLVAGIGSTVEGLVEVRRSCAEAERVAQIAASRPSGQQVLTIEDARAKALLLEIREFMVARPELAGGPVQRLVDHDAKHGTDYIPTLRAYLDHFGDVPVAAASIPVHANTFRYRLRRLCEVAGLDLDDPDERLAAALQIRAL